MKTENLCELDSYLADESHFYISDEKLNIVDLDSRQSDGDFCYISDLISEEEISSFTPDRNIVLSAPMGRGKTYFCLKIAKVAKASNKKVLLLEHRKACQIQNDDTIAKSGYDNIDCQTYQWLENSLLYGDISISPLYGYDYIIADEFHYLSTDGRSMNDKVYTSYSALMNHTETVKIFISATPESVMSLIPNTRLYSIKNDFKFIKRLIMIDNNAALDDMLEYMKKRDRRALIIIQNASKVAELYDRWKDCSMRLFGSQSVRKHVTDIKKYDEERDSLLAIGKTNKQFIFATTCIEAGISINEIRDVYVDVSDVSVMIQCIGRIRFKQGERFNVFIRNRTRAQIASELQSVEKDLEFCKVFDMMDGCLPAISRSYCKDMSKHRMMRQYQIDENTYKYKIDKIKYADCIYRKSILENMLKYDRYCFRHYISDLFNVKYDSICEFRKEASKVSELEEYLNELESNNVMLLRIKDRERLINLIGLKDKYDNIQKGIEILNLYLKENRFMYQIIQTRKQVGNINYSAIWHIEKR